MILKEFHDKLWWPDCSSRLRECTLAGYKGNWERYIKPKWGHYDMEDINAEDVEEWLRDAFNKPGSAQSAWSTFRIILRSALRYELLERDITRKVRPQWPGRGKVRKEQPVLDKEQIAQLIDGMRGAKTEPFVICCVTLGLRKEEGCALEWSDIDLKTGEVRITKGAQFIKGEEVINPPKTKNSLRTLFLPEFALLRMRQIHEELVDSGELHPRLTQELNAAQVTNVYSKEVRDRGLPYVPPKNLRHSWATCALREGVPISTVSKCLGHYDVAVTANHYIISSEQDFRNAQKVFQKAVAPNVVTSVNQETVKEMTFFQRVKFMFKGEF